ncbi:NAD-dependent epimerase/dehydratase family protein [Shouchella clausii]|uniref:NAD-dependent epimerase/dehydratase family protein n=1 Tax=Shouchella clausii TaxID=79880 RepID=UPI00270A8545|nr:NAD-dependent epimerase/dehydratase family protein [Shouchella clausii]MDO7266730.1 NAD-dependent epimerase/dehydratase family protein [Shouchella clausii]MDO7286355.1 NAD-dependent epimerase/dehydratase family protein [Shouchella clausii]
MKQVLVMGGTEFVGKAFLQQLINLGYSVDFLTTGRRRSTISGYTTHIKCNRKKQSDLTAALKHKQYHYIVDISAYDKEDVDNLYTLRMCLGRFSLHSRIVMQFVKVTTSPTEKPSLGSL